MLIFKSHPWIINCVLNTQISLTVCSQPIVPKTVRMHFLFFFLQNFYCHPLLHFSTKARVSTRQAAPCTSLYLHPGKQMEQGAICASNVCKTRVGHSYWIHCLANSAGGILESPSQATKDGSQLFCFLSFFFPDDFHVRRQMMLMMMVGFVIDFFFSNSFCNQLKENLSSI